MAKVERFLKGRKILQAKLDGRELALRLDNGKVLVIEATEDAVDWDAGGPRFEFEFTNERKLAKEKAGTAEKRRTFLKDGLPQQFRCQLLVDGTQCKNRKVVLMLVPHGEVPICGECQRLIADSPERITVPNVRVG